MKKSLIIYGIICSSLSCFSQGNGNGSQSGNANTHWKTNGNDITDTTKFIGTINQKPVVFKTDNIERFRLTPEGDFGIGTSTPQAKLDVNGSVILRDGLVLSGLGQIATFENMVFIESNGGLKMGGTDAFGDYIYDDKDCSGIGVISSPKWANGPNKIFYKCPQVNVGISTDDPLYKLDVRGSGYFSGSMGFGIYPASGIKVNAKTTQEVGYCIDHNSPNHPNGYGYKAIVNDEVTKGFGMYSNVYNKDVFAMYSTGQLIISNGIEKILQLETDGLLRARKIKVDLDAWADYVFDEDYVLLPLSEVEKYIKSEKHLPNVPSELELKENGLDLAEMNRILMEKIEELMLYSIQQQKEIDQLRIEIRKTN